jgi:hypothetical protein
MPVIAVNVAANIFSEIAELVQEGQYANPEQFLEIAAYNQLALERGLTPAQVIERGHRTSPAASAAAVPPPQQASGAKPKAALPKNSRRSRPQRSEPVARKQLSTRETDGAAFDLAMSRLKNTEGAHLPTHAQSERRPPDERLWGQVNRLFPMKLAVRWLMNANAVEGNSKWMKLDALNDRLADDSAAVGSLLEAADVAHGRKRDEVLATGLPRRGNAPSRDRFLSQFVARTTRAGEIYPGAICQYVLAAFDGDRLALTDLGVAMAFLPNPVLDGGVTGAHSATKTLSEQECNFFVRNVLPFVPGELHDFRLGLKAVSAGKATPDDLLAAIGEQFKDQWSPVMVRTHVSGAVARMVEMGLVRRRWEGRHVIYEVTDLASEVMRDGFGGDHVDQSN